MGQGTNIFGCAADVRELGGPMEPDGEGDQIVRLLAMIEELYLVIWQLTRQ